MSSPYVARAGEHEQLEWIGGGIMEVLLDAQRTGGALSVFRSTVPTPTASPVHVHPAEDEIFVMLSGSGLVWIGDRRFELAPGGVAFLPRGVPHAYRFTSDDVDMLAIATPSGMEGFFRDAGWNRSRPKPAGWAVTPEALGRAGAANGQIVLGPPLAPDAMIPAALLDGHP
ncbi:cupin domain-containing protein [Streptomyces fuscichromogenes]|uniref:Cupin n=1 Tax=Streptomyces fuscichromogenes TaxID=1324013 RepID=A0A918CQL1_9ACTN|nr:cupin domain-containing protein [Streptomyces fuscichromogenes]GGN00489.1 cupin [Streptomyces fuscichromogenes]